MYTRFLLTLFVFCLFGMVAQAQNFDKTKVTATNKTYLVKRIKQTVFLNDEQSQYTSKSLTYRLDTLDLSGLSWKKAQVEATNKIKQYLVNQRKISLGTLPNIATEWYILKTGQIKGVTFMFPENIILTVQDFEEMEKIITQTRIEVTQPQFYKSVNFIPIHVPFIWNR